MRYRTSLAAVAVIVGAACWHAVFQPTTNLLAEPYDFTRQFLPQRVFQVEALSDWEFPSWNPYTVGGAPFVGSHQPAFFSPSTLTLAVALAAGGWAPTPALLSLWQVAHLVLAGAGVLAIARLLGLLPWAGVVAAASYSLCGFMVGQSGHVNQQNTAAWIPWAIAAVVWFSRAPSVHRAATVAVAVGAVATAGHPQVGLYGVACATAAVVLCTIRTRARGRADRLRIALVGAAGIGAGVALAAGSLLPLLNYGTVAARAGTGYNYSASYSLPLGHLNLFVAPHLLGPSQNVYTGTPSLGEYAAYAGLLPLLAIPLALGHERLRAIARMLVVVALAATLFALGANGPLFPVLWNVVGPVLAPFRNPGRIVVVVDLALALIGGIGVDRLLRARRLPRTAAVPAALIGAVLVALVFVREVDSTAPQRGALLLAAATFAGIVGASCLGVRVRSLAGPAIAVAVALDLAAANGSAFLTRMQQPVHRDAAAAVFARLDSGTPTGTIPDFRVESDASTLPLEQDNGAVIGVPKTMGDDSLVFAPYVEVRSLLGPLEAQGVQSTLFISPSLGSPLLDMLGARYLFTLRSPGLLDADGRDALVPLQSVQGVWVYSNPDAFPLGWIVSATVPSTGVASDLLDVDLQATAVVGRPDAASEPIGGSGRAVVRDQGWSWIRFETDVGAPGAILATSLIDYPGWQVLVDGRPARGFRVNHAFRGVWMPPGSHVVEWRFRDPYLRTGLWISGLTALVVLGALVAPSRRRGRRLARPR